MELPLSGSRVLDLSRALAGPHCAQILGDLGAEVVKLENPDRPDEIRTWPPFREGVSTYFLTANRNKTYAELSLSKPEGVEQLHLLVEEFDVVVQNFRPEVAARFGLDSASFRTRHPGVILCALSGYAEGPATGKPAYDMSIQAESGLLALTGEADGPACRVGVAVVDQSAGQWAAIGVLAALVLRAAGGEVQHVGVSLYDAAIAAASYPIQSFVAAGVELSRTGSAHPAMSPNRVFATATDELLLMAGNDVQWVALCGVLGLDELIRDERFVTNADRVANQTELYALLEPAVATRSREYWLPHLTSARVPHAPVNTISQVARAIEAHSSMLTTTAVTGNALPILTNPLTLDAERLPIRGFPFPPTDADRPSRVNDASEV